MFNIAEYLDELYLLEEYISWSAYKLSQGAIWSFKDYKKAVAKGEVGCIVIVDNLTRLIRREVHLKGLTYYWHFTTFRI